MKRALIITTAALLLAPAGASAATTYTVGPGQSIADALAKATDGDTIHVLPGTYPEQPLTVAHAVRIEGEPGTTVTGDASAPVLSVMHDGVTITGLALVRTTGPDAPVMATTDATGTTTISRSLIVNATGGSGHTSPAVAGGQSNSLAISDSLIVSGVGEGPALLLAGGGANTLIRSAVAAIEAGSDAVQAQSSTPGTKQLTIDSSILSGGASAASLRASTSNSLLQLTTGNLTVTARHATIAGAASAIATQVTSVGLGSPGTISVSADRSILRGTIAGGVSVTQSDTSPGDVFVAAAAKNFHLRADAPVIDQGGPPVSGESDRDVDGQPRAVGAATDLGADEFVNQAPVGRLATPAAVRTPGAVTFDASASTDPEAAFGGGIAGYHFDFGDGATADSPTPTASHTYATPGSYAATVTVTDRQGLAGPPSEPVPVSVVDGVAPTVRIISPRGGKRIALRTKRGKRAPIRFTGSAADDIAVAAVGLTLQRIGSKRVSRFTARVQQGIWSYRVKTSLELRRGRYELRAYAADGAGNLSKAARVRFTLK
jgi:hypothetical protein